MTVLLVSIRSDKKGSELVLAHNLHWESEINLVNAFEGDEVMVSTSNGGTVKVPYYLLEEKVKRYIMDYIGCIGYRLELNFPET